METLSVEARSLFRLHVERLGRIDVTDDNRQAYRELEQAGLVMNSRPFTGNQLYSLTRAGYELEPGPERPWLLTQFFPRR